MTSSGHLSGGTGRKVKVKSVQTLVTERNPAPASHGLHPGGAKPLMGEIWSWRLSPGMSVTHISRRCELLTRISETYRLAVDLAVVVANAAAMAATVPVGCLSRSVLGILSAGEYPPVRVLRMRLSPHSSISDASHPTAREPSDICAGNSPRAIK